MDLACIKRMPIYSNHTPFEKAPMRTPVLVLALTFGVPSAALPARADEPIALKKIPPATREAAKKAAPGVKFTKAGFDEANKYYKLRGKDAEGRDVQVLSDKGADLVQVKVSTPTTLKDVPQVVLDAHTQTTERPGRFHFKATKIIRSEQTTVGSDSKTVIYQFIGKNADGEILQHTILENGSAIGLGEAKE